MITLKIEVDGLEGIKPGMEYQEMIEAGTEGIYRWVIQTWLRTGKGNELTSAGWPPLAASTKAGRIRKGYGTTPLLATGEFLRATEKDGDRILNWKPYAKYHQTGTRYMPARPIFPGNVQAKRIVRNAILDHIEKGGNG